MALAQDKAGGVNNMGIYDQIAQSGSNLLPVSSYIQGQQAGQQMRSNQLANQAAQFQNIMGVQQLIAKSAKAADTPEKWDQTVDYLVNSGIPGAEKYKGRFDMRNQVLSMFGQQPEYTYKEGGAPGGRKQLYAISGTQATPIGEAYESGGGTTINVGGKGEEKFWEEFGKGQAEAVTKAQEDAQSAANALSVNQQAKQMLESGIISGSGANFITGAGKVLQQMGIPLGDTADETIANTQSYAAMMGRQVGEVIRAFGSGTGLSDADREYAQKIAGGEITLTSESLGKLLDINDRINTAKIDEYNKRAKKLEASPNYKIPYSIQVKPQDITQQPQQPVTKAMQDAKNRASAEGYNNLGQWIEGKGYEVFDENGKKIGYYN